MKLKLISFNSTCVLRYFLNIYNCLCIYVFNIYYIISTYLEFVQRPASCFLYLGTPLNLYLYLLIKRRQSLLTVQTQVNFKNNTEMFHHVICACVNKIYKNIFILLPHYIWYIQLGKCHMSLSNYTDCPSLFY